MSWGSFQATRLLGRLVRHGVDFVVVGGIAMIAHGSARLTQDLDICFSTDQTNLDVLGMVLIELGARLRGGADEVPFTPDGRALARLSILTLDSDEGAIDLLRDPSGAPPYSDLRAHADRVELDGISFLIASLDDLAAMKRAAGRPKDLLDLEEIAVIRRLRGA